MRAQLTTDMSDPNGRPYFLWDEDIRTEELRRRLADTNSAERRRLLGKMLREARDIDVWEFVTPQEVADELPSLAPALGRRRGFWEFLIRGWRELGILPA